MPWQRLVADVGGEVDECGVPAYREVVLTVPRQNGKTLLLLAWQIQRAVGWEHLGPQRIAYSAQTGKDAREKLLNDQFPLLERHANALGIRLPLHRAAGSEGVSWKNGSKLVLLASTEDAGHGKTLDLAVKDELFADDDDRRDQALVPAMATRRYAQVLATSTMGTERSIPWNRLVERGRASVEAGRRAGIAYFEWSAPDDADADDPETWRACMPALGHTITEGVVAHARETLSDGEFRRAFLNQQTRADDWVIPMAAWNSVCRTDVAPQGELVFAVDVNPERSAGAIVAASGEPVVELVDYRPGTGWILDRAVELNERWGRPLWVIDGGGPAGSLITNLERAGLKIHPMSSRELIDACASFYDAVIEARIQIRRHEQFDQAAAAAGKRQVGDAWAWTRRSSTADVSPLVAATIASWAAQQKDRDEGTVNLW